ncbi:hypothetical protein PUNSTDRAFT_45157 [Punctularia strigosozonata HHB-11173 SS5]|uniref:uncharacterized protein n=1 Tax=Punctularia strigosozonata (strain HHB-11173) TaxID=741275 RepID=UPI0004417A6F|nr:uncharacterized protein PUNSTDRAFT_45157 [Punctularia strigosozonata HHB-11173 SS5]EIN07613.1 hypothetical protein PUNSTDRAFT_45157 [Punctularia strigosozonata HHB-11173 SS5]
MVELRNISDMPPKHSKQAPGTFKGDYTAIQEFLDEYERLCKKNNMMDDAEKVQTIRGYCSRSVWEVMEGMENYLVPDLEEFKKEALRKWNDDKNNLKFVEKDLEDLGVVKFQDGHIVQSDGSPIMWGFQEPIVRALERTFPQTNLVTIPYEADFLEPEITDAESEPETEDDEDYEAAVYMARKGLQSGDRSLRSSRKEVKPYNADNSQ